MPPVFYLDECASTQDECTRILLYGDSGISAVYTFNQTRGKGQYGNSWESLVNRNIAYSFAVPASQIGIPENLLNFYTAIILRDFLANLSTFEVEIKWPNDLIIRNKKISGILIEKKTLHKKPYFIIGIGLNVLQENFEHLPKAGSLLTQTGIRFHLDHLVESFHGNFSERILQVIPDEEILTQINKTLFRKDVVSVFEIKGIRQNGIIRNVDEEGFLWIELENDGLSRFFHKEINMLY
ncbi:biotin--[acetyl-CoA-carboxylase] ligase [Chryseobacterium sp. R2A-55]|uniref:biotin--[acetyl-CoA-carboxylase] ligase n=1 Tax=Chryseobacterium sp. R2A-55 TaxID=2744445 RepID=UPI001F29BC18|nr:biotin--[acetyl-CoA-carboxylase] ligase [Chryseobacterium sp. R2A-55]